VPGLEPALPRIRYADSLVSRNDRCIVAGNRLNLTIRPVYVNGQPIGFGCSRCPGIFAREPEKYLRLRHVRLASPLDASSRRASSPPTARRHGRRGARPRSSSGA